MVSLKCPIIPSVDMEFNRWSAVGGRYSGLEMSSTEDTSKDIIGSFNANMDTGLSVAADSFCLLSDGWWSLVGLVVVTSIV